VTEHISYFVKAFTSEFHFFPRSISLPVKVKSFEIHICANKKKTPPKIQHINLQCNVKLDIQTK